jgi:hypothetical protein
MLHTVNLLPVAVGVVVSLMDERGEYLVGDFAPLSSAIVKVCQEDEQVHGAVRTLSVMGSV